jgi:hypothetical protein
MKRLILSVLLGTAISVVPAAPVLSLDECVRNNDVCLSIDEGTVTASADIGAIDAEGTLSPPTEGGVTADAGAVDVQAGTDREECLDAGAINVPPDQEECPPSD